MTTLGPNPPVMMIAVPTNIASYGSPSGQFWTIDFTIAPQTYNASNPGGATGYFAYDLKDNMWFSNKRGGWAWRLSSITVIDAYNFSCIAEDVDLYNFMLDSEGFGIDPTYAFGYIFQTNLDGLPELDPLQPLINPFDPANPYLDAIWASDLYGRFNGYNNSEYISVLQPGNTFQVGNFIWLDPSDQLYKLSTSSDSNLYNTIGTINSVDIPYSTLGYFTFYPRGKFFTPQQIYTPLPALDPIGTVYYLDSLGALTSIKPDPNALPVWIKVKADGSAILLPNAFGGSVGGGSTGPQGPTGAAGTPGITSGLVLYMNYPYSGVATGSYDLNINPTGGSSIGYTGSVAGYSTGALITFSADSTVFQGLSFIPPGVWNTTLFVKSSTNSGDTTVQVEIGLVDGGIYTPISYSNTQVVNSTMQIYDLYAVVPYTTLNGTEQLYVKINGKNVGPSIHYYTTYYLGTTYSHITTSLADNKGSVGPTGAAGPTGADGMMGPTGAQGEAGPTGADGMMGPTGAQGEAGPTGAQGLPGDIGPTGPTGSYGQGNFTLIPLPGSAPVDIQSDSRVCMDSVTSFVGSVQSYQLLINGMMAQYTVPPLTGSDWIFVGFISNDYGTLYKWRLSQTQATTQVPSLPNVNFAITAGATNNVALYFNGSSLSFFLNGVAVDTGYSMDLSKSYGLYVEAENGASLPLSQMYCVNNIAGYITALEVVGATGAQGPTGTMGPTGADGMMGPTGAQGNALTGATGADGATFMTLYVTNGTPTILSPTSVYFPSGDPMLTQTVSAYQSFGQTEGFVFQFISPTLSDTASGHVMAGGIKENASENGYFKLYKDGLGGNNLEVVVDNVTVYTSTYTPGEYLYVRYDGYTLSFIQNTTLIWQNTTNFERAPYTMVLSNAASDAFTISDIRYYPMGFKGDVGATGAQGASGISTGKTLFLNYPYQDYVGAINPSYYLAHSLPTGGATSTDAIAFITTGTQSRYFCTAYQYDDISPLITAGVWYAEINALGAAPGNSFNLNYQVFISTGGGVSPSLVSTSNTVSVNSTVSTAYSMNAVIPTIDGLLSDAYVLIQINVTPTSSVPSICQLQYLDGTYSYISTTLRQSIPAGPTGAIGPTGPAGPGTNASVYAQWNYLSCQFAPPIHSQVTLPLVMTPWHCSWVQSYVSTNRPFWDSLGIPYTGGMYLAIPYTTSQSQTGTTLSTYTGAATGGTGTYTGTAIAYPLWNAIRKRNDLQTIPENFTTNIRLDVLRDQEVVVAVGPSPPNTTGWTNTLKSNRIQQLGLNDHLYLDGTTGVGGGIIDTFEEDPIQTYPLYITYTGQEYQQTVAPFLAITGTNILASDQSLFSTNATYSQSVASLPEPEKVIWPNVVFPTPYNNVSYTQMAQAIAILNGFSIPYGSLTITQILDIYRALFTVYPTQYLPLFDREYNAIVANPSWVYDASIPNNSLAYIIYYGA